MLIELISAGVVTACALVVGFRAQRRRIIYSASQNLPIHPAEPASSARRLSAVVNQEHALLEPYGYIFIEKDGTARELFPGERAYLETPFEAFDGARPYIKKSYDSKNGWGDPSGFLERTQVPAHVAIQNAPHQHPIDATAKEDVRQFMAKSGFEVTENADGSVKATRPT